MKRKKRLRKKLAQWQCPQCDCQDGIVGHIIKGNVHKQVFLWCSKCNWQYILEKE